MDIIEIFNENKGIAKYWANRYHSSHLDYDETFQIAYYGFLKGLHKADKGLSVSKILSYSTDYIKKELRKELYKSSSSATIPKNTSSIISSISKINNPDIDDVKRLYRSRVGGSGTNKISNKRARDIICFAKSDNDSSYKPNIDNKTSSIEKKEIKNELKKKLKKIMNEFLNRKEKDMVCRLYGIDCPSQERTDIADTYGISHQKVTAIVNKAYDKMKNKTEEMNLREYLDDCYV